MRNNKKEDATMIAGEMMTLTVKREVPFGYFLTNGTEEVLLHKSEMERPLALEEEVTVFCTTIIKDGCALQ